MESDRFRRRPEKAAVLPVDLDGNRYRVFDGLGPWKVTPCCGASVKGIEDGIVCRSCFSDMLDFPDGPARLHPEDPEVRPARETAVRFTLTGPDKG